MKCLFKKNYQKIWKKKISDIIAIGWHSSNSRWIKLSCHVVSYLGIFVFIIIIVISYYYCDLLKWNSSFLFISIYFAFHLISSDCRGKNQMLATPMTMVMMLSTDLSYIIACQPAKLPIISLRRFLLLPLTLFPSSSYFHACLIDFEEFSIHVFHTSIHLVNQSINK